MSILNDNFIDGFDVRVMSAFYQLTDISAIHIKILKPGLNPTIEDITHDIREPVVDALRSILSPLDLPWPDTNVSHYPTDQAVVFLKQINSHQNIFDILNSNQTILTGLNAASILEMGVSIDLQNILFTLLVMDPENCIKTMYFKFHYIDKACK